MVIGRLRYKFRNIYASLSVSIFLLLHRAFFKFADYHTPTNALLYYTSLKFTLKTFKSSYIYRSSDNLQGAYNVPS